MLRMDQVHVIRHKVLREGASIRQVARELGLSRNTVSKYLDQSVPERRTYHQRQRPVWERVQSRLEELVAEWEPRTTAKQRLTGVRLYRALLDEGYQVGLTMIYQYLRERRRQRAEVYVPLIHRIGDEAHAVRPCVRREDEIVLLRHQGDAPEPRGAADKRRVRLEHVE